MSKAQKQTSISSCFGNEEDDVLSALRHENLSRFTDLINERTYDIDKEFQDDPCKEATLLEACCKKGLTGFCEVLLSQPGIDVNRWSSTERRMPIHIATDGKHPKILSLLLDSEANVNGENWLGETALHIASRNNDLECLKVLFTHPNSKDVLDRNALDKDGRPPVYVAATEKCREVILFLAENGADLQLLSEADDENTLELLEQEMPDLLQELNKITEQAAVFVPGANPDKELLMALEKNDLDKFQQALTSNADVNRFHGDQTCLHLACEKGKTTFVEFLLKHKAKTGIRNEADNWAAIHYAAAHGYFEILVLLDKYDADLNAQTKGGLTPLHLVAKRGGTLYKNDQSQYEECLEFLLGNDKANINATDHLGSTPFHFAVRHREERLILQMLKNGADFTKENEWGERPLDLISPQTMNTFFRKFIDCHGKDSKEFTITFNYDCFLQKGEESSAEDDRNNYAKIELPKSKPESETKVLRHIAKLKKHRELLKHPLVKSFLYLKWQKCRKYYFANTLLYVIFVAFLTFYCIHAFSSKILASEAISDKTSDSPTSQECPVSLKWYVTLTGVILFFVNTILAIRETFQFLVAPVRYVSMVENLAEWAMIICLYIVLVMNGVQCITDHLQVGQSLAAVTLFLAWVELVLLCGRYRKFSVSVSIFIEVSWNFVKLMAWYIVFICGFVVTFFLLFEPKEGFETLVGSFMKVMVMMTGEFDYGGIPIGDQPVVAHLTFLLFLFFVTIVLMNLLTGLAVEDTRKIRNNAEIVYQKTQLDLVSYIEAMFFGDYEFLREYPSLSWVPHCFPMKTIFKKSSGSSCFQFFGNSILLFYKSLRNHRASVKPDHATCIVETDDSSKLSISKTIIKDTLLYLEGQEDEDQLFQKISSLEDKVQGFEERFEKLDKKLLLMNSNLQLAVNEITRRRSAPHPEARHFDVQPSP